MTETPYTMSDIITLADINANSALWSTDYTFSKDYIPLGGGSLSGDITSPTHLKITNAVTIYTDGRVEVDPKYTTTEAARQFWEAVQYFFKTECESCKNSAEKTKG